MWPAPAPLRVVIADDDEPYAELIADLLHGHPELEVIGIAKDGGGGGAARLLAGCGHRRDGSRHAPHRRDRRDSAGARGAPRMCVLMLSGADPKRIQDARDAGAAGYVDKQHAPAELVPALLSPSAHRARRPRRLIIRPRHSPDGVEPLHSSTGATRTAPGLRVYHGRMEQVHPHRSRRATRRSSTHSRICSSVCGRTGRTSRSAATRRSWQTRPSGWSARAPRSSFLRRSPSS